MANYKTYTILLSILSLVLILLLIFGGKKTIYVCYDGTEQKNENKCPSVPPLTISVKEAKNAIIDYSTSYARSKPGTVATVIGDPHRVNSSWQVDVGFSNTRTEEFNQLTFNIDGKTSAITCINGCEYLLPTANETS